MAKTVCFYFLLLTSFIGSAQTFKFNEQIKGFGEIPNRIFSIGQDKKGFIWITSNRGTQFSDGIMVRNIPDSVSQSFSSDQKVWTDQDGEIWLYQSNGKPVLYHYDLKSWIKMDSFLEVVDTTAFTREYDFFTLGQGNSKGLLMALPGEIIYQKSPGAVPLKISSGKLGELFSCQKIGKETLLFFQTGVYKFSDGQLELKADLPVFGEDEYVVKMIKMPDFDQNYFLTNKGLYEQDVQTGEIEVINNGYSEIHLEAGDAFDLFSAGNKIYYHFNSQVNQYNLSNKFNQELSVYDELKVPQVSSTFLDREGILWVGSYRGLANLESVIFHNFDEKVGVPKKGISALIMYTPSEYLLGFENGIQLWKGANLIQTKYFSESDGENFRKTVLNFSKDTNGNVWFSVWQHGLGFFNASTQEIKFFSLPDKDLISYVGVEDGHLITAGENYCYQAPLPSVGEAPNFKQIDLGRSRNTGGNFIRKIGKLKNGKWLVLVSEKDKSSDELELSENSYQVTGYDYFEKGDTLFIGRDDGFYALQGGKLKAEYLHGQKIDVPVYAILEDSKGKMWLGTDSGVILKEEDRLRIFNENNGLVGNDIGKGALANGTNGTVLVGTQNGISVYLPAEDKGHSYVPLVHLENMEIAHAEPYTGSWESLPNKYNSFIFRFTASSFVNSPDLFVKYKLKGLHDDWQLLENPRSNTINFNNLPPGKYQLAIKASLGTYPDSETVYSPEFFIRKPFYFRGWFIFFSILVLIALGYGISTLIRQTKDKGILKNSLNEKINQIALREDRFRIVWNNSQDGLILSVSGGKVIAANPTICEMANVSEDELRTHGLNFLFDKTDFYETVRNDVIKELQSGDTTTVVRELVMPLKSGDREIEVLISRMEEVYEEKVLFLSVFRDISKKKAYEKGLKIAKDKAEEVSQLKSNIISNMSHEIRTPLNGILGGTEYVMQMRAKDEELLENLEIIKESGERLLSTITNFLDLALLEANEVNIILQETNINDFISKLLINHKSEGIKKGILVTSKFLTKPFVAKIERKYLEIIINKIVGNSVKYTERGSIKIFVENNNHHLDIKVCDQGIGMSKAYLDKLFYPFEQESNGFNRKFEGSGLGLTITKHLVEKLKGQINIESKKGNGTIVKISLPLFT